LRKVPLDHNAIWPVPTVRKISIVVPVFNGERYLAQTLNSMLAQSCSDFEIIGVDDCSTDGSYRVLQEFAARDSRVRPLRTSVNMGSAPKVLNFALTHMTGGYFVYASQDDLFSKDWLEKMLARSLETGADAVIPDVTYYYEQEPQRNRHMVGVNGDRQAQLTGREAVVASLGWTIPGNALWNAELIKKMGFAEFAINSDEYSVRRFFNVANKVVFCDGEFLYRQDNANAITKKKSVRYFDFSYTHLKLAHWLFEQGYPKEAVLKELKSARKGMAAMAQWYAEVKQDLSEAERQEVDKRMARYTKTLSDLHPLGKLPRRYF
jgi:glycosyltransferase involved in cell wall biosynthesis